MMNITIMALVRADNLDTSVGIDGEGANGYCTLEKGGHLAISEGKLTFAPKWGCKLAFNPMSSEILGCMM